MRKMMVLAVMLALAALMLAAAPAMASPKHDGPKGAHQGNWDRWDNNHGNSDPWDNNGNWDPWNNNNGNCDPWDNNNGNWDPWNNNNGNWHPWDDDDGNCQPFNNNVPQQIQVPTQTYVSGSNTINGGSVYSTGDNSNTCVATQNFNNSGGLLEQPSLQQFHSSSGSVVFVGGTFVNAPQQNVTCNPSVQQSATASSGWSSGWST